MTEQKQNQITQIYYTNKTKSMHSHGVHYSENVEKAIKIVLSANKLQLNEIIKILFS